MSSVTVLITGANRGIGLALAQTYLTDGAKVIATCRHPAEAAELHQLQKDHQELSIEQLEVTQDASRKALAAKLGNTAIDILINNAGIYSGMGAHIDALTEDKSQELGSIDKDAWMDVLRTNSIAPVMLSQELLANLENGKEKKIIMMTSEMASIKGMKRSGDIAYRTSKTILNAATKSIALHLQLKGYLVAAIHPGWVRTRMGSDQATHSVEESANSMMSTIAKLSAKDTGSYADLNGEVMPW